MQPFRMPKLGADMTEGRLLQWLKHRGDRVARGEVIALVETDKANVDVESFVDGVLSEVVVEPSDQWLPVGTTLAMISTSEQEASATPLIPIARPEIEASIPEAAPLASARPELARPESARVIISPAARHRSQSLGLDASRLPGSGPGGRITLRDIDAYLATMQAAPSAPAKQVPQPASAAPSATTATPPTTDKRQRMRDAIAAAMARSKREIPHYYLATSIDLGRALQWLAEVNAQQGVADRLIAGVLLIKAVALALRSVPELNGFFVDGHAQPSSEIHVGTAISLRGGGLVAPALLDTDRRSLSELMHDYQDLVQRARAGSLRSAEMMKPTITVTSLGDRGVDTVFGVIYPPQVALLGFGRPVDRPWVRDGQIVVRPIVHATLSADHRASDGHRGGLLLDAIDHLLQEPDKL